MRKKMSTKSRLDALYKTCERIRLPEDAKILFIADLHEMDGSPADDYAKNEPIFVVGVSPYYPSGHIIVILGDRKDLWEQKDEKKIDAAHHLTEALLKQFKDAGRLIEVLGNHNNSQNLPEAVVLQIGDLEIFCTHGHAGDTWNDSLWWVGQNVVRYLWVPLQWLGFHDVKKAKQKRHEEQEQRLINWAKEQDFPSIFGHTHLLRLLTVKPGKVGSGKPIAKYLNAGSWVGEDGEAIEYANGVFTERRFV